jgi:hypothetical protein
MAAGHQEGMESVGGEWSGIPNPDVSSTIHKQGLKSKSNIDQRGFLACA